MSKKRKYEDQECPYLDQSKCWYNDHKFAYEKTRAHENCLRIAHGYKPVVRIIPMPYIRKFVHNSLFDYTVLPTVIISMVEEYCFGYILITYPTDQSGLPKYIRMDPYRSFFYKAQFDTVESVTGTVDRTIPTKKGIKMMFKSVTDSLTDDFMQKYVKKYRLNNTVAYYNQMCFTQLKAIKEMTYRKIDGVRMRPPNMTRVGLNYSDWVTIEHTENNTTTGLKPSAHYSWFSDNGKVDLLVFDSWYFNKQSPFL